LGTTAAGGASTPPAAGPGRTPGGEEPEDEELGDYERTATPAAVLQRPDGSLTTLSRLTAHRAALLVFVSEGCGPCERVLDQAPGWIEALSPFLQVHFVFSREVGRLRERTTDRGGDLARHDLQFTARSVLGARTAPSAVLRGADGLLAGGPVGGGAAVIEFVEEIRAQLATAQEQGQPPCPTPRRPVRPGTGAGLRARWPARTGRRRGPAAGGRPPGRRRPCRRGAHGCRSRSPGWSLPRARARSWARIPGPGGPPPRARPCRRAR